MASVWIEETLERSADHAWPLLRDVGSADKAFPGVLVAAHLDGDIRSVTFASGVVVRERIVAIDDDRRRIAYAVIEGRFSHHSASMQILPDGPSRCRFIWISDVLPNESAALVRSLAEAGTAAFKRTVEAL